MHESLQVSFLNRVLAAHSKRAEAIDSMCSLLSIGKDAIYRRIRGDSELTLDEVKVLANHYGISLDELIFQNNEKALFAVDGIFSPIRVFNDFVLRLEQYLDFAQTLKNPEVNYATAEIPMFLYATFPELLCFKMFVWGKTVWNIPSALENKFSFDLFSENQMDQMRSCSVKYMSIKTTELWCLNILDNTLNQILFVLTNGNFKTAEDSLVLCDKMSLLIKHVWKMAETGKKFNPNDHPNKAEVVFELFHNELVFTNNTILLKSDSANIVFSTFDSPNVLSTADERIFQHTENWFQGIKSKSEYITAVSEKSRNQFFNRLENKIEKTRQKIRSHIDDLV